MIELWLAKEQFPNYEIDLPNKLIDLIQYGFENLLVQRLSFIKKLVPCRK